MTGRVQQEPDSERRRRADRIASMVSRVPDIRPNCDLDRASLHRLRELEEELPLRHELRTLNIITHDHQGAATLNRLLLWAHNLADAALDAHPPPGFLSGVTRRELQLMVRAYRGRWALGGDTRGDTDRDIIRNLLWISALGGKYGRFLDMTVSAKEGECTVSRQLSWAETLRDDRCRSEINALIRDGAHPRFLGGKSYSELVALLRSVRADMKSIGVWCIGPRAHFRSRGRRPRAGFEIVSEAI